MRWPYGRPVETATHAYRALAAVGAQSGVRVSHGPSGPFAAFAGKTTPSLRRASATRAKVVARLVPATPASVNAIAASSGESIGRMKFEPSGAWATIRGAAKWNAPEAASNVTSDSAIDAH